MMDIYLTPLGGERLFAEAICSTSCDRIEQFGNARLKAHLQAWWNSFGA